MKKLIVSTIVAFTLGSGAASVYAGSHPSGQSATTTTTTTSGSTLTGQSVFGVVDVKRVVSQSTQLNSIKSQLEPKHKAIVKLQKELGANLSKLSKNDAVLSNSEKDKLKKTILGQRNHLMALQTEFFKQRNTAFKGVISKVKSVVATVAQRKGIDVVFFKEALVYAKAGADIDITDSVIKSINTNS